jgi:hypothetical protein
MNDVRHRVKYSNQTSINRFDPIKLLFISLYDNDHLLKNKCLDKTCGNKQFKDDINQADKNQNKRHKICLFDFSSWGYLHFFVVDVKDGNQS